MEPKQLINKIREAYLDARKIAYTPKENNKKIKRGTSHSISSLMEDLLGVYCAERINNSEQMQIYIDPPSALSRICNSAFSFCSLLSGFLSL